MITDHYEMKSMCGCVYRLCSAPVQVVDRKWRMSAVSTWQWHRQDGVRRVQMSSLVLPQSVRGRTHALHTLDIHFILFVLFRVRVEIRQIPIMCQSAVAFHCRFWCRVPLHFGWYQRTLLHYRGIMRVNRLVGVARLHQRQRWVDRETHQQLIVRRPITM